MTARQRRTRLPVRAGSQAPRLDAAKLVALVGQEALGANAAAVRIRSPACGVVEKKVMDSLGGEATAAGRAAPVAVPEALPEREARNEVV